MKKIFILLTIALILVVACEDQNRILEPVLSNDKIDFPKKELDDGTLVFIYRNYEKNPISMSLIMLSSKIILDSDTVDFCEGVTALREGKVIQEWTPINYNYSLFPESEVINQNDHPNLISYNFPVGTYMLMLMDSNSCSKENYVIFDVKRNKYIEGLK